MRWLTLTSLIIVLAATGFATTLNVPTVTYPTIQSAINAAAAGDTVLVARGTYMENIDFLGKGIEVTSVEGSYVTFIDGGGVTSVVRFASGEGVDSVLDGFTITNGSGTIINGYQACGGGIFCDNASSPTIRNNDIMANHTQYYGAGVYCQYQSSPLITDNRVFENFAEDDGAGIACWFGSNAHITNNEIMFNHTIGGGAGIDCWESDVIVTNNRIHHNDSINSSGGGMRAVSYSNPIITSNTFVENYAAGSGGGIAALSYTNLTIYNCIFWDDSAPTFPEIYLWNFSTASVNYSDVKGGYAGPGNINLPPLFVAQPTFDYHLTYPSPCRDTGFNGAPALEATDFEGDPRIAHQGTDMGADEFYTHFYCTGDFTPGGAIEGKFIDLPGSSPVGLFIGSGILDPPMLHAWGLFYLKAPWLLFVLVPIPANGVLTIPATLPATPTTPYFIPMQGLIAFKLTNLFVMYIR